MTSGAGLINGALSGDLGNPGRGGGAATDAVVSGGFGSLAVAATFGLGVDDDADIVAEGTGNAEETGNGGDGERRYRALTLNWRGNKADREKNVFLPME